MLLGYNCDMKEKLVAASFDAWIVHSGDSNHTKWHASSESVDLLEFFPNSGYSLLHEFSDDQNSCWLLNYRLKRMHLSTSPGMVTTAFFSGCKHVLIIKLMMPTASYKLEDSTPLKKSARDQLRWTIGFIICLLVSLHLPIFKNFYPKKHVLDQFWPIWKKQIFPDCDLWLSSFLNVVWILWSRKWKIVGTFGPFGSVISVCEH